MSITGECCEAALFLYIATREASDGRSVVAARSGLAETGDGPPVEWTEVRHAVTGEVLCHEDGPDAERVVASVIRSHPDWIDADSVLADVQTFLGLIDDDAAA